jgi:branched-chain amino acid transport system substrate-binding protein
MGLWLFVLAVPGCGSSQKEPMRVGAVISTTGALAESGVTQLDVIALSAEQINSAGGVLGKPLQIVFRDAAGDTERAARMAQSIRADISPVILGDVESVITRKLATTVGPALLIGSASATAATIPEQGQALFSLAPSIDGMAKVLVARALSHAITRMSILYTTDRLGDGLPLAFHAALTASGLTVLDRKELSPGRVNYLNSLTSIMASTPQAILLDTNPTDGAQIIRDYLDGFARREVLWMFSDRLSLPSFVEMVGPGKFVFDHEGISPAPAWNETYDAFERAFVDRYGRSPAPGAYPAQAYDAVYLTALGLASSPADGETLLAAIEAAAAGGGAFTPETYAQASEAIGQGEDVNFEGASGSLDPGPGGRIPGRYDIWRVVAGQISIEQKGLQP